jgi:hypothetical protein
MTVSCSLHGVENKTPKDENILEYQQTKLI